MTGEIGTLARAAHQLLGCAERQAGSPTKHAILQLHTEYSVPFISFHVLGLSPSLGLGRMRMLVRCRPPVAWRTPRASPLLHALFVYSFDDLCGGLTSGSYVDHDR